MGQEIQKVAVIGTGVLGTQISIKAAHFGYGVFAYDIDGASFYRAHENIKSILTTGVEKGFFTANQWDVSAKGVRICKDLAEAVGHADLVIEAVPENIVLKRKVFENIDALAPAGAILASNSSSIPISKIESSTTRPEQCLNIHFYSPAMGKNMADIMGGTKTLPEVMETGKEWIRSIGCVPLTVKKESFGFCFNRVWRAIKRETLQMWAEGIVDFEDIDRAWMIYTGMPRGPFGLMDNVGLDVVYDIEMVYFNESKDPKDRPPDALKEKIEGKELGLKTGKGFYTYPNPEYGKNDFLEG
jgi:3-hydroxybutyryl-CoA dehydrogenase